MTRLVDLHNLSEDERIRMIGHAVIDHGQTVAFITDSDPGKADRYIAKLQRAYPGIIVLERTPGPVPNTVTVKVGPTTS